MKWTTDHARPTNESFERGSTGTSAAASSSEASASTALDLALVGGDRVLIGVALRWHCAKLDKSANRVSHPDILPVRHVRWSGTYRAMPDYPCFRHRRRAESARRFRTSACARCPGVAA